MINDLKMQKDLITKARRDPQAFSRIYEEYCPQILKYAIKRTGNIRVAEDITSEVFYKALKGLWKFRWQNVPISAWLYKIASNEINTYFRKGKHRTQSLDLILEGGSELPDLTDVETEADEAETRLQEHREFLCIREELQKLPTRYQDVLALKYFENKKIKEIAEILGKKEGTVKVLIFRGLEKLRENIYRQREQQTQPFSLSGIVYNTGQEMKNRPEKEGKL